MMQVRSDSSKNTKYTLYCAVLYCASVILMTSRGKHKIKGIDMNSQVCKIEMAPAVKLQSCTCMI